MGNNVTYSIACVNTLFLPAEKTSSVLRDVENWCTMRTMQQFFSTWKMISQFFSIVITGNIMAVKANKFSWATYNIRLLRLLIVTSELP